MPVPFKGNINGTVLSQVYTLPFRISFFQVANLNAGATTLNLTVTDGVTDVYIAPQNLVLAEGDMLQDNTVQVMPSGNQIKISSSANVSYYFTIDNITPD